MPEPHASGRDRLRIAFRWGVGRPAAPSCKQGFFEHGQRLGGPAAVASKQTQPFTGRVQSSPRGPLVHGICHLVL